MTDQTIIAETRVFMTRQRDTLLKEREQILNEQHALQERLAAVNEMLAKFDAFEGNAAPKPIRQTRAPRAPQARRGSKREALLQIIKEGHGLTRGEILEKMGLRGDKSGEMSVSNALTALSKANQVSRQDGRYVAA